ncbi:Cytochrome oxidase biogenesis protein [Streptomyces venezuelae]|uniref:SURF1 family cytochrome oxidase biogenesis protein n=1 Tax=Streptomyces gardneri TaxID=66892 RepID=UPI0006BCD18C|nr:SURF1 family protein [Streptomyces gardneri]ALO07463.1 Cytochrome oxidase biogenesis protein [Streptomyces venezuelae]QPK44786.1 SURF1 family protein [Streptomyces gardneri]WRK36097.1 SURF1 family protein [Streptomyces venezuelae]CUM42217.1 Cytochrome oxidase biogenesis protein Surf1, facilitates heme A insertion [Streptomyces venezuelae]
MYRFLLSRQWVILTLIALVLVPTMIELGFWQFHRHERRVAQNALIADNLEAKPVPVEELTSPGHTVPRADYWRRVTATGTFDTAHEVVVRRRTSTDDRVGVHVLTPLVLRDGRVLLVNRGWVPAAAEQRAYPPVPPAPKGEITVTGRLKADETTGASGIKDLKGLPDRQVMLINSEQQAALIGREVLGGYLELITPESADGTPEPIAEPDHESIGAHMAYAVQWWLFAAGVPVGWVILVRREVQDRRAAARAEAAGDGDGEGDGDAAGNTAAVQATPSL